jgi:uncharacterized protein YbaP (TraB family)
VVGLRSLESHFQMFARLPRRVQESLLRSALGGDEADELLWHSPELMPQIAAASPERAQLYEHLIYRRNEQMAERLFEIGSTQAALRDGRDPAPGGRARYSRAARTARLPDLARLQ